MPSVDFSLHQYLLMGDEAILIHTGTLNYSKELIPKLKEVLDGKNLKYIYVSHFESDECGGLSEILKSISRFKSNLFRNNFKTTYGIWNYI